MIQTYKQNELDIIRAGGKILGAIHRELATSIKAGVSTLELDAIAAELIQSHGAESAFLGFQKYPFSICTSVNDAAIHGIPSADEILRDGDIISIDIGIRFGGFCTDAARTHAVGEISPEAQKLIEITQQSFFEAIKGLRAKSKVGDIGERIEKFVTENSDFSIIDTYFGHGIGRSVHQDPLIPNFVPTNKRVRKIVQTRLPAGCVICIEPMINIGGKDVATDKDKWTVRTTDGSLSAHYENTVIITENGAEVVTL